MRTIIAGDRNLTDILFVFRFIERSGIRITEVVTGDATGVDWIGAYWGYIHGIPVRHFPAQWNILGRAAGPRRNMVMADYADALIAIWMEGSRGTKDMIRRATGKGLTMVTCKYEPNHNGSHHN